MREVVGLGAALKVLAAAGLVAARLVAAGLAAARRAVVAVAMARVAREKEEKGVTAPVTSVGATKAVVATSGDEDHREAAVRAGTARVVAAQAVAEMARVDRAPGEEEVEAAVVVAAMAPVGWVAGAVEEKDRAGQVAAEMAAEAEMEAVATAPADWAMEAEGVMARASNQHDLTISINAL